MTAGIKPRIRAAVFERDGWTCAYCGKRVKRRPFDETAPDAATVDHVRPVAHGGRTVLDNLLTACFPCNQQKADHLAEGPPFEGPTLGDIWPEMAP
jgi:5-methylcytosine-specific restriction endonuclease McrA